MALATRHPRSPKLPPSTRSLLESLEPRQLLSAAPATFFTLARFDGTNGSHPAGHIAIDSQGNLFGATLQGGTNGTGTLYEIPSGSSTIVTLANFTGPNGQTPLGDLRFDSAGNLWGVTQLGGTSNNGTIFELPAGAISPITVANFTGANGATPLGGLVFDSSNNLYGTTELGGASNSGTVFVLPAGATTPVTLASFNRTLGVSPVGTLVRDSAGNLFGATAAGGPSNGGTIFEIPAGTSTITTLHAFGTNNPHVIPSGLALDSAGNLFGVTQSGGANGNGTLFKIDAGTSTFTTLINFDGNNNGSVPIGSLVFDNAGNLFGTASNGSVNNNGLVYELPAGGASLLAVATFGDPRGVHPVSLAFSPAGTLFGTTAIGGSNDNGTVFGIGPVPFVADRLVFGQPPLHATPNTPINPAVIVYVEDAYGHVVTTGNPDITLTLVSGPAGVGLAGTRTMPAQVGAATFSDLTLSQVGAYTMAASSDPLNFAISDEFTVGTLPTGYLDAANRSTITGWGFDADTPNSGTDPASVRINIDGSPIATFPASLSRPDLATYAPVGSPNHGFSFATPNLSDAAHTVDLFVQDAPGTNWVLAASKIIPATPAPSGNIEFADRAQIVGWAFNPLLGQTSAIARIDIDGIPGTPFIAADPRSDLTTYAPIGSPNHGFTYVPPALSAGAHTVQLFIQDPNHGTFTLAATSAIAAQDPAANTAPPSGYIDGADRTQIVGWGFDGNQVIDAFGDLGSAPSLVRVDIDGVPGIPFIASDLRPDLAATIGSPAHGFTLPTPLLASGAHTVDLFVQDYPAANFVPVFSRIIPALYPTSTAAPFGNLEVANRTQIVGWAFDADAGGGNPILVRIDIDGVVGTPFQAGLARPDLTTYAPVGSPNHGFNFPVPTLSSPLHLVTVWLENAPTNTFTQLASFTI